MHDVFRTLAIISATLGIGAMTAQAQRPIPQPLPGHPGNVFLAGQRVIIALPAAPSGWRLVDYDDRTITHVPGGAQQADLGVLPVGFYRLRREGSDEWVSLAVLERLKAPTPPTSPIGVDVAMAWFYPEELMPKVASLAALAGVNRVRDRLSWGEMEPERGKFAPPNKYDASARAQAAAHLRVLQVNHSTPSWAGPEGRRFPPDLRDAYRFYREMARRWKGLVEAFEPWNEADIPGFGGHTGSEMAALQKASYLGLKAGNPSVTACLNVFAVHNRAQLDDLDENRAWPYFDTYNLHHYEAFEGYPKLYADHRSVSAGRPLWVTECAMPVKWSGDPALQELADADLKEQSERIAKVFAGSLHERSRATFYFILGHYVEGQTQFGIIRRDLTPRPAYVALAAVGRLLADARPMGRLKTGVEGLHAYVFRAKPDGKDRAVVVAWMKSGVGRLTLPSAPELVTDHLGRPRPCSAALELATAPTFAVLPVRAMAAMALEPPPASPRRSPGKPCSVVLQATFPSAPSLLWASGYRVSDTKPTEVILAIYNFGSETVTGSIHTRSPKSWSVEGLRPVTLRPMERVELNVTFVPLAGHHESVERVVFEGDFGSAGKPVASVRLAPDSSSLAAKPGVRIDGADDPAAWELMVSGGPRPTASRGAQGVEFEAAPTGDPWFYPRIKVPAGSVPRGVAGLACTLALLEGEGVFRAIFDERNGSSYVSDFVAQPKKGETVDTVALLSNAAHGAGWSAPDTNGKLDADEIVTLKIGCNGPPARVRFRVSDVRWVKW